MLAPKLPDFDMAAWRALPHADRVKWICQSWASDGYGTPMLVYAVYGLKILGYIGGWLFFCTLPGDLALADIGSWWASDVAFAKAIAWTMLFEGLGLGCGSGPLTGRYLPPVGGALYFLRPGTTKLPLVEGLPLVGGHRRTLLDVGLYGAVLAVLVHALATSVTAPHLWALLALVPVLGLLDRTLFLVFRSEHYLSVAFCLLFDEAIAGAKVVWMAIWWWAATSKVNAHFPSVIGVMTSNAPFTRGTPLRRWIYRDAPNDLRASGVAAAMAHTGTVVEYLLPALLLASAGGPLTTFGLVSITVFHLFILANVPMGVPLEWNVIMIYGAWVLFGVHADVSVLSIASPALVAWLVGVHLVLPLVGSRWPQHVSFLLSMRYYAGNWAYSVWLFRPEEEGKLGALTTSAPPVRKQLGMLYDDDTIDAVLAKVVAFRHMHVLGRALHDLVPRAVDDVDGRTWLDGELVAGAVLGWNFGEGHLSQGQLLRAVQAQCGFAPGELRCVFVESQPLLGADVAWSIHDAADGEVEAGTVAMADLVERHPWPAA